MRPIHLSFLSLQLHFLSADALFYRSEPGIPQPRSAAGRAAVALAAAQRDLNQRIASGDVDAASEWQSLAPEVNLQTFGGERLREVALALSLNDGMLYVPSNPSHHAHIALS